MHPPQKEPGLLDQLLIRYSYPLGKPKKFTIKLLKRLSNSWPDSLEVGINFCKTFGTGVDTLPLSIAQAIVAMKVKQVGS